MELPINKIVCGDCREVMKAWPDNSIDCCVTSPPYWGLRDYKIEPVIWSGDRPDHPCEHIWGDRIVTDNSGGGRNNPEMRGDYDTMRLKNLEKENNKKAVQGQLCVKCGAWLGSLGLEPTIELYVRHIIEVFQEVRRVLKPWGTLWLNIGDSYYGNTGTGGKQGDKQFTNIGSRRIIPDWKAGSLKLKDLCMIPARVALALQQPDLRCNDCGTITHQSQWGRWPNGRLICPSCEKSKGHKIEIDGWWLRQDIIWHKPNPMPESITDRCTKSHEYLFLLAKSGEAQYWTNEKTGRLTSVQPAGTKGNESEDWEWRECSRCKGKNCKDNKRCIDGRVKSSFWEGHDYFFDAEAIKEEAVETNDARPRMGQGPNTIYNQKRKEYDNFMSGGGTNAKIHSGNSMTVGGRRNRRSVWTITTQPTPEAHFATFPERLVEPCIMAGTSEKGCCPKCGRPRERIVKASEEYRKLLGTDLLKKNIHPLGWTICSCKSPPAEKFAKSASDEANLQGADEGQYKPSVVLDPFIGSGTTGKVALRLGRDFVGIEISEKYVNDIANWHIEEQMTGMPVKERRKGQQGLFSETTVPGEPT